MRGSSLYLLFGTLWSLQSEASSSSISFFFSFIQGNLSPLFLQGFPPLHYCSLFLGVLLLWCYFYFYSPYLIISWFFFYIFLCLFVFPSGNFFSIQSFNLLIHFFPYTKCFIIRVSYLTFAVFLYTFYFVKNYDFFWKVFGSNITSFEQYSVYLEYPRNTISITCSFYL